MPDHRTPDDCPAGEFYLSLSLTEAQMSAISRAIQVSGCYDVEEMIAYACDLYTRHCKLNPGWSEQLMSKRDRPTAAGN